MCVRIKNPKLNAGHDRNVEVVLLHTIPYVRQNMELKPYDSASSAVKTAFRTLYLKDAQEPKFELAMIHMGVESENKFTQWLICNFGGDNEYPDYNVETGTFYKEYWDCGQKEFCPGFGIVCRKDLSPREFDIIKLFKDGVPDKLISEELHISENTIKSHRRNLFKLLNAHNKQEAINSANQNSIII